PSLSPHCHLALLHLPSFPTRRSSDLGSATQPFTLPRICSISSRTSARSAHLCPSASISSLRSLPPLSVSSVRVSETTSTAILSRSEEHTSELQSRENLVCRLLLEKKN